MIWFELCIIITNKMGAFDQQSSKQERPTTAVVFTVITITAIIVIIWALASLMILIIMCMQVFSSSVIGFPAENKLRLH